MIRFLRVLAQILVLIIVALASTLISMRFAIHGREVFIPDFRGMAPAQAERVAFEHGLEIARSDHFYSSTVPAGRIVSQQPDPGTRVRRGWRVQAAESLGVQLIEIPAVVGMSARAAEINLRRRGLELGAGAELPTDAAAPQFILAQTPSAGAQGIAAPRVSLLAAAAPPEAAYAMPDLSGLPLPEATALITQAGLKTVSVANNTPAATRPTVTSAPTRAATAAKPATVTAKPTSARPVASAPPTSYTGTATTGVNVIPPTVVGQSPAAGARVTALTPISLEVARN
jgi:beta-lactam-binding protein with PASTA domain